MPLFNCFPYLLTDLLNEYFPQADYSLLDKREGKVNFREEFTRKHCKGIAFLSLKGRKAFLRLISESFDW